LRDRPLRDRRGQLDVDDIAAGDADALAFEIRHRLDGYALRSEDYRLQRAIGDREGDRFRTLRHHLEGDAEILGDQLGDFDIGAVGLHVGVGDAEGWRTGVDGDLHLAALDDLVEKLRVHRDRRRRDKYEQSRAGLYQLTHPSPPKPISALSSLDNHIPPQIRSAIPTPSAHSSARCSDRRTEP